MSIKVKLFLTAYVNGVYETFKCYDAAFVFEWNTKPGFEQSGAVLLLVTSPCHYK